MAFDDVADPTRQLTDPAERTESILGQPFSNFAAALDWLSPSHIVNEFIKQACGYDTRHALTRMLRWEQRCRSIGRTAEWTGEDRTFAAIWVRVGAAKTDI